MAFYGTLVRLCSANLTSGLSVRAGHEFPVGAVRLQHVPTLLRQDDDHVPMTVQFFGSQSLPGFSRRVIVRIFETIDVLVTPTTPVPPPTIAEISKDVGTSMRLGAPYIRNTSPFDVYGIPTISVPCGFTT